MFIDEVVIKVEAGNGGDGCLAFRREKYVAMGGPFGGNGGHGSNIIFKVDEGLHTLIDLRYMKTIKGKKGENGRGKNQNGAAAEDVIIKVPQGTIVTDLGTGFIIADLKEKDDEVVVAYGGRGGRGNTAFKTQSNPAPNFAENGEPGEVKELKVELKLLADVGLVGMPSVGKSTIISCVSKAKPKIAAYHFTTLNPNLGVARTKDGRSFVIADLPGLIEGASLGEGLGDRFLKHIERTRVIAHVIDMSAFEGRDPYLDYVTINKELENFNKDILKKPEIIIANKMDLPGSEDNLAKFKEKYPDTLVIPISAMYQQNIDEAIKTLMNMVEEVSPEELYDEEDYASHVVYKYENTSPFTIKKVNGIWQVSGDEISKLFKMTKFTEDESIARFSRKLKGMGVEEALINAGATLQDDVEIEGYVFKFKD